MVVLESPMSGKILSVNVKVGDRVKAEDELIIMESMKMEIPVPIDDDAAITAVLVKPGDEVNGGAPLLEYE